MRSALMLLKKVFKKSQVYSSVYRKFFESSML
jgi:hypothetical protein